MKLKPPPGGDQEDLSRGPSLFTVYDANTREKLIQIPFTLCDSRM